MNDDSSSLKCNLWKLIYFFFLTGHRWNCTQVWKKDVFGHVVIVGEYIYLIKIYILKAASFDFKFVFGFSASACMSSKFSQYLISDFSGKKQ